MVRNRQGELKEELTKQIQAADVAVASYFLEPERIHILILKLYSFYPAVQI